MGTEVLGLHDILSADRFNVSQTPPFQRRRRRVNPNLTLLINQQKPDDKTNNASTKKPITKKTKKSSKDDVIKIRNLVNGHVTLLKRGESLDSFVTKSMETAIVNRPETPVMVPKKIRLPSPNMYAGSVIMTSPSPRALPKPSFFNMKGESGVSDDFATRDLRRLLRLE